MSIVEEIRAEEDLNEGLQIDGIGYQSIFENTGTVMLIVEEDMTISLAKSKFEQLTGYRREDVEKKKKWTDFIHPSDLERMIKQHKLRRADSSRSVKN